MNITKLIPWSIKIRSSYWINKEKEINVDLTRLFNQIDDGNYVEGFILLDIYKAKWRTDAYYPKWFAHEYLPKFVRAESMLNFLSTPLEN